MEDGDDRFPYCEGTKQIDKRARTAIVVENAVLNIGSIGAQGRFQLSGHISASRRPRLTKRVES